MSINSYLCKHFEQDYEGNVKLNTIVRKILINPLVGIYLYISICGGFILGVFSSPDGLYDYDCIMLILKSIGIVMVVFAILFLIIKFLIIIWKYVGNINVAKCKLKENKE